MAQMLRAVLVGCVHSDFFIGAHFGRLAIQPDWASRGQRIGGFREQMAHVLLLDMAIHTFDAARLLAGADPLTVYCKEWNPSGSWYAHGAAAVAIFEMTGGIVYTYRGSWCAEGLNTTWAGEWRISGEKGSVRWDGGDDFQAQAVAETGGFFSKMRDIPIPPLADPHKVGGHAGIIREFVRCMRTGETPETICTDNSKSLSMVFGAVESAETGQSIKIL